MHLSSALKKFRQPQKSRFANTEAFTLMEVLVSLGVMLIALTGIATLNSSALALTRSAKQATAASLTLQERVEQLRTANWQQVTDAEYLRNTVLSITPRNTAGISPATETITISAYPNPATIEPVKLQKTAHAVRILTTGSKIANESLATLAVQLQWPGKDGRINTRESVTILSRAGISRLNLSYPQPTDTTSVPPETSTPGNNGQGRGNAAGKPGTK
jgi:type II secretory pathway pseudopilin PulG